MDEPETMHPEWKLFHVYLRQDMNKIVICKLSDSVEYHHPSEVRYGGICSSISTRATQGIGKKWIIRVGEWCGQNGGGQRRRVSDQDGSLWQAQQGPSQEEWYDRLHYYDRPSPRPSHWVSKKHVNYYFLTRKNPYNSNICSLHISFVYK